MGAGVSASPRSPDFAVRGVARLVSAAGSAQRRQGHPRFAISVTGAGRCRRILRPGGSIGGVAVPASAASGPGCPGPFRSTFLSRHRPTPKDPLHVTSLRSIRRGRANPLVPFAPAVPSRRCLTRRFGLTCPSSRSTASGANPRSGSDPSAPQLASRFRRSPSPRLAHPNPSGRASAGCDPGRIHRGVHAGLCPAATLACCLMPVSIRV
jgi:hypothetical protein